MPRVTVVTPEGQEGTIDAADVASLPPGSRVVDPNASPAGAGDIAGGLLGIASPEEIAKGQAARAFGAGASVSGGLLDRALGDAAYIVGGDKVHRDLLTGIKTVKEAHPYQYMAGEGFGLLAGPVGELGAATEAATVARAGEGLLGGIAAMGARGAVEGAVIGAQHQITEDTLADHDLIGQQIFAAAGKDALFGAGAGAALGAGGYALGRLGNALRTPHGPLPASTLDEIAGVEGAGKLVQQDARSAESMVEDLRKAGATSDQAVKIADEARGIAKTAGESGPLSGLTDSLGSAYAARRAGGNAEMADTIARGYAENAGLIAKGEAVLDANAQKMARAGTKVMRLTEDTANEVQFTAKSDQFAKLVDATKLDAQRDQIARLLQESNDTLNFWEGTAAKGGAEGAIKKLRKQQIDTISFMSKIDPASPKAGAELYIRADKFKRALDAASQWGQQFGLPEAVNDIRPVADKWRGALEDASVWGKAGEAQTDWNAAFSNMKARRDHFGRELGVAIDQQRGISLPEVDFKKTRGMLSELRGSDIDADLQAVKSTEAFIDGTRNRAAKLLQHGDLTEAQRSKVAEGLAALDEFQQAFTGARTEAAAVNRLKAQQLEEHGKGIGGLLGLLGDVATRPLTTMQRLAEVRHTARSIEKAVERGLSKAFAKNAAASAPAEAVPRAKDVIAKEIGEVKGLAGNPVKMQERLDAMVGDLPKHAPGIAEQVKAAGARAITFLAREAPIGIVRAGLLAGTKPPPPRYSDQEIHAWESKRKAALGAADGTTAPETVLSDLHRGKLNREAIRTIEFVSPKLFAQMQELAQDELARMDRRGELTKMPYAQRSAIGALLKIPADQTFQPDFIGLMQASKLPPQAPPATPTTAPQTSKREVKMNTDIYATEAGRIEAGAAA